MNKFLKGKITLIAVLGLAVFGGMCSQNTVYAQIENTDISLSAKVHQESKGSINWEKGSESDIEAIGIGLPPENMGARGNVLARRAAVVDAQRNLAEIIQGVQIDSDTVMENLVISSDVVRNKVSAMVRGARIVEEGTNEDGSYFVKMRVPMYGVTNSIASAVLPELRGNTETAPLPEVTESTLSEQDRKDVQSAAYTGIVINATAMGLEPTFSPVIYDVNGRIVYGIRNLDYDQAISKGMVAYASALEAATHGNRAGDNPLVINAVEVRGGKNSVNKVNVVVSVEDGDRILLASEKTNILQNCAVVFVK